MTLRALALSAAIAATTVVAQIPRFTPRELPLTRFICRLASGVSPSSIAARYRIVLLDTTSDAPFALFLVKRPGNQDALQAQMRADPDVVWVEDDQSISTPEGQAGKGGTVAAVGGRDQLYDMNSAYLEQINWSESLANSNGRTVRLAILDTGLSPEQLGLWTRVSASSNMVETGLPAYDIPRGVDSNANGVQDESVGHGTMVTGLADLIGPRVNFVIARVADSDGNATAWRVLKGLAFAVANGAEVANISLGSTDQIVALTEVLNWCEERNLLVVAPTGNDSVDRARYPARISKVICVAGLAIDDIKADFSNWDGKTSSAAPATGLASSWWDSDYVGLWSGTSFASPMVSASVANALRRTTPKDAGDLKRAVEDSGVNIDGLNPPYSGQLGTKLNFINLDTFIRNIGG
ncbi:MAG: S8 family serine peptidase [Fimbriimonadaceae bacterium]